MRQQRRLGRDAKAHDLARGHLRDFGELLGRRVVVHVGVHQKHLPARQHQRVHGRVAGGARALADHLVDVLQMHGVGAPGAADEAFHIAAAQQHGAYERQPPAHLDLGQLLGHAAALHQLVVGLPQLAVAHVVFGVDDVVVLPFLEAQTELFDALGDDGRPADQGGAGQSFVHHDLRGAQHPFLLALGVGDALVLRLFGDGIHRLHDGAGGEHEGLELLAVGVQIGDGAQRHAAALRRLGHGRGDLHHQPRIERLGDQVLGPERQLLPRVGRSHHLALLGLRQLGDRMHRGDLHLIGDGGGPAVQRSAEDVGEAQDVVDLVGIVGAAGGHDGVVAHGLDLFGQDLGRGVGQRQNEGLGGHAGHHVGLEHAPGRQAQKHVGAFDHLGQRARIGFLRELGLVRVHQLGAALVHHASQIGDPNVLARHAQLDEQVQTGQGRRASAAGDELDLLQVLAHHLQAIEDGRPHHDGRAVLVVVEDGNVHPLAQLALDVKAVRGLDVFQVHAAESGLQRGDDVHQPVRVFLVDFDVEHIDAGELFEQHALALHHRLGRQRADVAQAQHRRAVGDDGDQVAARRVLEGMDRIGHDFLARRGHPGGISQCQVALVGQLLGRRHRHLAGGGKFVVLEGGAAQLGTLVCLGLRHGGCLRHMK